MLWSHAERATSSCEGTPIEAARPLGPRALDFTAVTVSEHRAERPCKRNDTGTQTGTGRALDAVFAQSKIEFQCHNSADVKIIEARGDRWACARRRDARERAREEGAARQSRAAAEARARADMSLRVRGAQWVLCEWVSSPSVVSLHWMDASRRQRGPWYVS